MSHDTRPQRPKSATRHVAHTPPASTRLAGGEPSLRPSGSMGSDWVTLLVQIKGPSCAATHRARFAHATRHRCCRHLGALSSAEVRGRPCGHTDISGNVGKAAVAERARYCRDAARAPKRPPWSLFGVSGKSNRIPFFHVSSGFDPTSCAGRRHWQMPSVHVNVQLHFEAESAKLGDMRRQTNNNESTGATAEMSKQTSLNTVQNSSVAILRASSHEGVAEAGRRGRREPLWAHDAQLFLSLCAPHQQL
jgi:hypothetical protein